DMPRRIAQERVPTASNVGSRDVTWASQPTPLIPFRVFFACFAGPIPQAKRGNNSEGQVKYCRRTFFWTSHAGSRRSASLLWGLSSVDCGRSDYFIFLN